MTNKKTLATIAIAFIVGTMSSTYVFATTNPPYQIPTLKTNLTAPSSTYVKTVSSNAPPHKTIFATATCDSGDVATGGGYQVDTYTMVGRNAPTPVGSNPTGWVANAINPGNSRGNFDVYVICEHK